MKRAAFGDVNGAALLARGIAGATSGGTYFPVMAGFVPAISAWVAPIEAFHGLCVVTLRWPVWGHRMRTTPVW